MQIKYMRYLKYSKVLKIVNKKQARHLQNEARRRVSAMYSSGQFINIKLKGFLHEWNFNLRPPERTS